MSMVRHHRQSQGDREGWTTQGHAQIYTTLHWQMRHQMRRQSLDEEYRYHKEEVSGVLCLIHQAINQTHCGHCQTTEQTCQAL